MQRRIIHEDYHQVVHVLRRWHQDHVEGHEDPNEAILVSMRVAQMPAYANWEVAYMPSQELAPLWKGRLAERMESATPDEGSLLVMHVDEAYTEGSGRLKWIAYHVPKSVLLRSSKRRRKRRQEFRPFTGHHDWEVYDDLREVRVMLDDIEILEDEFDALMETSNELRKRIDRKTWEAIEHLIDNARRSSYEKAVDWLVSLAQSHRDRGQLARFERRLTHLLDDHSQKYTFVELVEEQLH